ncbi:related to Dol-P-Man:Man(5)GlcNAc(2)-PP-Dol alpha-1,3-mannosyltransferase [Saccharomycodes ludwigii]|uniref:Dol-P-Man:Man(5)GlcNAc(2)-PP-Dol alpha-1,3-mannosyltransferase n=1 Tax=Saccharomycodes ludwigii TaxID=36035 RepID=A0A376B6F3_9ASCO|nr:related to Dol-P-Man:Man(5)GlcNAc(2)-PP-Dol alpha-1,3-mannosyltransferase [Saccharomycodes ludwigii]
MTTKAIPDKSSGAENKVSAQPLTLKNLLFDLLSLINYLLFDPESKFIIMAFSVLLESLALKYIIFNVPYTEIDYKAYMEQISMIVKDGVTNYELIRGNTGPLVYPAGHVLIYRAMNHFTQGLKNLKEGQIIFRYLYISTLMVDFAIYFSIDTLPPWCILLACLSKRLHSIYVLRLFNDCFTTLFIGLTCLTLIVLVKVLNNSRKNNSFILSSFASFFFTFAVSIKMNALLYFPGILIILVWCDYPHLDDRKNKRIFSFLMFTLKLFFYIAVMIGWQIFVAYDFLSYYPKEYLHMAFQFDRKFMYIWSINWQFVNVDFFNSDLFGNIMLLLHLITLFIFMNYKWLYCITLGKWKMLFKLPVQLLKGETAVNLFPLLTVKHMVYVLVTCNYIGVIFSRSLHYQFLSWYHWTIPLLVYYSSGADSINTGVSFLSLKKIFVALAYYLWYFLHEYAWNLYPPQLKGSLFLFSTNFILLITCFINYKPEVFATTINITDATNDNVITRGKININKEHKGAKEL